MSALMPERWFSAIRWSSRSGRAAVSIRSGLSRLWRKRCRASSAPTRPGCHCRRLFLRLGGHSLAGSVAQRGSVAMTANLPLMSGGQLVVAALRAHGVRMAFSVAGESYLEVLDALYDAPEIRLITCRQEGGAAFMGKAFANLPGKRALCWW